MIIDVVAAIIRNDEGKILIAQRNLKKSQGGLWEFPGGKIELGETKEQAIVREIKEELNMDIVCENFFDKNTFEYPDKTINLIALNCSMRNSFYEVLEHEQILWVTKDELKKYKFAPADIFFVNKLN